MKQAVKFKDSKQVYNVFNDAQKKVVETYFKWWTKKSFLASVGDLKLRVKPEKTYELVKLMGNATDWYYDGCVDTGYKGGGHCELGHALRYKHYAYSPSLNKSIVFGIQCVSDFFNIPSSKIYNLQGIQKETAEEIELIAGVLSAGKYNKYVNKHYSDLIYLVKLFVNKLDEVFGKEWNQMMGMFLKVGLPFTPSLIKKVDKIKSRYENELKIYKLLIEVKSNNNLNEELKQFYLSGEWQKLFFTTKILRYTAKNRVTLSERQKTALLKLGYDFYKIDKKLESEGVDISGIVKKDKIQIYKVKTPNGSRFATPEEIKEKVLELYREDDIQLIPEDKLKGFAVLYFGKTGDTDILEYSSISFGYFNLKEFIEYVPIFRKAIKELGDIQTIKEFVKNVNSKYETYMKQINNIDKKELEKKKTRSLMEGIEYLCKNEKLRKLAVNHPYYRLALDIARTLLEGDELTLTHKQWTVLAEVYKEIISEDNESDAPKIDKIYEKIDVLLENKNSKIFMRNNFVFKVINTVQETGRISVKQRQVIEKAYAKLEGYLKKNNAAADKKNKTRSLKDDNNKTLTKEKEIKKTEEKKVKLSNKPPGGMPTLTEISDALGEGELRKKTQPPDENKKEETKENIKKTDVEIIAL